MILLPGANVNRRTINLDTAQGNPIPNEQDWSDGSDQMLQYFKQAVKFPKALARTKNISGVYNCHGLVFACRRTMISEAQYVRTIVTEDGYKRIQGRDALPGDVVLYVSQGDVEHSAIVVSLPDSTFGIVQVVSKWGVGPEYVHPVNDSPYDCTNLEFYRIER